MNDVNGYFQLFNKNGIVFIKLVPEKGNGEAIHINDIMEYLSFQKMEDYNLEELNRQVKNLKKEEMVLISQNAGAPVNEYMKIDVPEDKMTANVRFYPPSNDGKRMGLMEMKDCLKASGIVYGIDETVLLSQVKNPVYCTDLVVARGKEVCQGKDAYIEYKFNTDRRIKPKRNEDGSVDFHQLNNISHIKEGDTLAVLHPAEPGKSGTDVKGGLIRPRSVSQLVLKYGKNIGITEDKLSIYSMVNGHAVLQGDRVFVSNVYDVPGDVDNSTGDIDYEGNVLVHGNIRTGFRVKAVGDVEVYGSVEGAEIIAGGQVILHRGIQGMTKGKIVAKGNVVTKFIESCQVYSEGYIEAEAIIQSQVSANDEIRVNGKRGQIIGGHIRSAKVIEAKVIGSGMGIATVIEVGYNPGTQDKVSKIKEKMASENEEYKKLTQLAEVLNKKMTTGTISNEQKISYKNCLVRMKEIKEDLLALHENLDNNLGDMQNNMDACIKIQKVIYPGTQLIILGEYYNILNETSFCRFCKKDGKIVMAPF